MTVLDVCFLLCTNKNIRLSYTSVGLVTPVDDSELTLMPLWLASGWLDAWQVAPFIQVNMFSWNSFNEAFIVG